MINGKKYIGQRKYYGNWQSYLGSGTAIKNAIKKYDRENFSREIIAIGYNADDLNELEIQYIGLYNAAESPDYYNITVGGGGNGGCLAGENHPNYGKSISEKQRRKISDNHADMSKEKNPMYGKTHSEETRKKQSENRKGKNYGENHPFYGKHFSEQHCKALSESKKGKFSGENNPNYGKPMSEEQKKKISEANKGKIRSEETKTRISEITSNENNPRARKIVCITTDEVFECIKYGAEKYKTDNPSITNCCRGKRKSAGKLPDGTKLVWQYYEDYIKESEVA